MLFYEIRLRGIPKIGFAVDVDGRNFRTTFHCRKNFLEICVNKEENLLRVFSDGTTEIKTPRMIGVVTQDMDMFCAPEDPQKGSKHITVGVDVSYSCVKRDAEKERIEYEKLLEQVGKGEIILIPHLEPLADRYEEMVERLELVIHAFHSGEAVEKGVKAVALWFSLVSALTELTLQKLSGLVRMPSTERYVERAKLYIKNNYMHPIGVSEISQHLHISSGYLQELFKQYLGTSVLQYINAYRIQIAKRYIQEGKLLERDIAKLIGVPNVCYLSRLFKKVTGKTYREYVVDSYSLEEGEKIKYELIMEE